MRKTYQGMQAILCTQCGYCLPCPEGVNILKNFELYNDAAYFGGNVLTLNRNLYNSLPAEERASNCCQCAMCGDNCPQGIPVWEWLPRVDQKFSGRDEA